MMPSSVKVPVGFIRRYWRQLMDAYINSYSSFGETLEGKAFDNLVTTTAHILKVNEQPIREALISYYGRVVTIDLLTLLAFKLAGGRTRLLEGKQLSSQLRGTSPAMWLAVFISDCELVSYAVGDPKLHVSLIVASGEFSGVQFEVRVPLKYWIKVFAEVAGFPRWSQPNEKEMVQMYFMGMFDISDPTRIKLVETGVTANMLATNDRIRSKRKSPCMEGYKNLCHHCWLGYSGSNRCSRACRSRTLVKAFCRKCGDSAFFVPGYEHKDCVSCTSKAQRSYRQKVFT